MVPFGTVWDSDGGWVCWVGTRVQWDGANGMDGHVGGVAGGIGQLEWWRLGLFGTAMVGGYAGWVGGYSGMVRRA